MLPFWIALQFLSSLPIRLPGMPQPQELGRSLLFYPLVGLLFGVLLWSLNALLAGAPLLLHAALLLSAWVLLSGGLHLDGLADSADAWLGGFGDRERTLTIMKDPRSGPIAVVTLVLVLLLKFCALLALIEQQHTAVLLIAPLIGRSALLAVFLTTPYVRAGGLGQALADHLPHKAGWWVLGLSAVACVVSPVVPPKRCIITRRSHTKPNAASNKAHIPAVPANTTQATALSPSTHQPALRGK